MKNQSTAKTEMQQGATVDVFEAIQKRYSVRSYRPDPVPDELLNKILEAARLAPSASNRQEWHFVVVRDEARRHDLARVARNQMFIAEAPVIIAAVATGDHVMRSRIPSWCIDVAIAVDHMTLVATAQGLGTCWIGAFDQDAVCQLLGVPGHARVVALLPIGYPADSPKPKRRKEIGEITSFEQFR